MCLIEHRDCVGVSLCWKTFLSLALLRNVGSFKADRLGAMIWLSEGS